MHPGRVIADRYEVLAPIASGAMSAVWEARDQETATVVAVKMISLEQTGWNAEVRDRFQREAKLLSIARHEHLVGVHAIGETEDGYLFLILERLTGETLADRLTHGPRLSWQQAATIALELADGLGALHERGIVHRDMKPANVILHPEGGRTVSKIIDLGISKVGAAAADPAFFATLTATGQVLGTPAYMSYEQAIGERDVDARTDVWALGVVLHEMLAGRRPFEGANVNAVLASIRKGLMPGQTAGGRSAPPAIWRVIQRCLSRDRTERYANGSELRAALARAIPQARREQSKALWATLLAALAGALVGLLGVAAMAQLAARAFRQPSGAVVRSGSSGATTALPPSLSAPPPSGAVGSPTILSTGSPHGNTPAPENAASPSGGGP